MAHRAPVSAQLVDACARGLLARERARRRTASRRARELRRSAEEAARILVERHGARRVWLFGSLAWGEAHEGTDVDLLVEGLPASRLASAVGDVEAVVRAPVDLVRAEEAAPGLSDRVREAGTLLA